MKIDYISIGKQIRKFRMKLKITQNELAELACVEPTTISHIERGTTKLSLPTIIQIANALNVSLDDIVSDNLVKSSHISEKRISELLTDCTPTELKAIEKMIETTKVILRIKPPDIML